MSESDVQPEPTLVRGITRNHLIGLLINSTIGAGILGLPSKVFALVGSYSLVTWLLCACPVVAIALCLAEVSTRFRESGGPYLYARAAFGPTLAFITGWLRLLTTTLAYATVCNLLIGYLTGFVPAVARGMGRVATITLVTGGLALVLARGLRETVWLSTALSAGKVLLLVLVILAGAFFFDSSRLHWTPAPHVQDFASAILLSIFAFFGFEAGSVAGGELSDPNRDMPVAIAVSVGMTTALYVLIQLVCIGTLGSLTTSTRPVADAATAMLGTLGSVVVSVGAVPLLLGVLITILISSSRTLFAMGERGQMPVAVSFVHPLRRTPLVAITIMTAAAWIASIASSFTTAITIAVGTRVLTYIVICASLPILRRRNDVPAAHFRLPAGDFIAGIAILGSIALLAATQLREGIEIIALVGIGLLAQKVLRRDL
jgi:basic amino acid/polyamine antiporter, APA family